MTGLILKEKAKEYLLVLYPSMYILPVTITKANCIILDDELPKFSDGWLDTWKMRHGIKELNHHDGSGSAECVLGGEEMETIRQLCDSTI